jgi:cobalt-zinc-cadmium efflux system protein
MAALVNGLFMLALVIGIVVAAVERLNQPQAVVGGAVFGVVLLGLIVNIIVLLVLSGGEKSLNIRGAMLHVLGDLLGSVAAMIAGAVIYFTGWTPIDPILSIVICALILFSSFHLLLDVLHVIMEGVPRNIDLPEVGMALAAIEGVNSVHDLHIWTLASGKIVLTAHAEVDDMSKWLEALDSMKKFLRDQYDIDHVTIQPEPAQGVFPLQDHTGRE